MKFIKFATILFILLIQFAIAQNLPEGYVKTEAPDQATFQPNILPQIFNYRNESSGPLELYSILRGREIPIGKVYGLIQATPEISLNSITIRNGNYSIKHENADFTVSGEFILDKTSSIYPLITLINGTVGTSGIELECSRTRQCIMLIDAKNGWINLTGTSLITRRRTETTKEYTILAMNVRLKPKQLRENIYLNLDFEAKGTEGKIGKYKLATGSSGKYELYVRPNLLAETIYGGAHILEIENPLEETLVQSGDSALILDLNEKELLRLHERSLSYTKESFSSGRLCQSPFSPPSCFNINQDSGNANVLLRRDRVTGKPTKLTLNLDNGAISKLDLFDIKQTDTGSTLIAIKPSLGNRKIVFTRDNVIVDGNWEDFGISFSAFIYSPQEDRYDHLECKLDEHKCYVNNQPVILRRSAQGLNTCSRNSDCNNNLACVNSRCVEPRTCRTIIESESRDPISLPINIVFIGDGVPQSELEGITRSMLFGANGLFITEPFRTYKNNFNIMTLPNPPLIGSRALNLNSGNNFDESTVGLENCPEAEYKIIISKRAFGPFSTPSRNTCFLSVGTTPEAVENRRFLHEFGHCFGNLADEYHSSFLGAGGRPRAPNCIAPSQGRSAENIALTEWTRLLNDENKARDLVEEAKNNWKGCGGLCYERCNNYLRPSLNSVMRTHTSSGDYNEISRLWLEQKIRNHVIG